MNVRQLSVSAVALSTLAIAGCADRPGPTAPPGPAEKPPSLTSTPTAWLPSGDPNAIPIGTPGRIEFLGSTREARRTFVFPLGAPPADLDRVVELARDWVAAQKARGPTEQDARIAATVRRVEQLLAARTAEEMHAALGTNAARVQRKAGLRQTGAGRFEHTVTYALDGRDVLRLFTNVATQPDRPAFYCADDPTGYEFDPNCPPPDDYDGSDIDPEQIIADVTAMTVEVDAIVAQVVWPDWRECDTQRAAVLAAAFAHYWYGGEVFYYYWRRDMPNLYKSFKGAVTANIAVYLAFFHYLDCLRNSGRPRL
jgi:hypothetical protein